MADGESFDCDSDEEVFFGKITAKEWAKAALYGQNYFSPVVKSTPRSTVKIAITDSTPTVSTPEISASAEEVDINSRSKQYPSANSSYDESSSVEILEAKNNSVQIISDDESFLLNEEMVKVNDGVLDLSKDICLKNGMESLSLSSMKEEIGQKFKALEDTNKSTSIISCQDSDALENTNQNASIILSQDVALEDTNKTTTITSQDIDALENTNQNASIILSQDLTLEDTNKSSSIIPSQVNDALEDTHRNSSLISNQDIEALEDISKTANDIFQPKFHISERSLEDKQSFEHKSILDQSINEDNIEPVKEYISGYFDEANKNSEINSPVQRDSHMNVSVQLSKKSTPTLEEINLDCKRLSYVTNKTSDESDYVSLNGISDSVLEISHGSSLGSPLNPKTDKATKSLLANIYEDISCDGESQFDSTSSACALPKYLIPNEDLHMSVDEDDYQLSLQMVPAIPPAFGNTSQLSYNSCLDKSISSSYHTAFDAVSNGPNLKTSVDSFNSYRDTLNDTGDLEEIDKEGTLDIDNAKKSETSFEMIVQKRQNSFTPSSPPAIKKALSNDSEQVKSKVHSKLPVYNHGSKSLIKPPKLNVTAQNLKSTNHKWAKNLTKLKPERIDYSNRRIEAAKDAKEKVVLDSQQKSAKLPKQASCTKVSNKFKSPLINKTPLKTTTLQAEGMVKSESKIPSLTSSHKKNTMSSEKKIKSKIQSYSQEKDRYKNVISPIRLYISGTTPVLQEKAVLSEETTHLLVNSGNKTMKSHLPVKMETPLTSSRVVQKLKYEKKSPLLMPQQENVDPNYTRDTLPPRVLENPVAVFMKEPEPPKRYLPKIGENFQKLLDTPRPKVVLHQGRVKSSPTSKGILVPSFDIKSPEHNEDNSAARVSIRLVKPAESSNDLK